MAAHVENYVLDNGLSAGLKTIASHIYICAAEPTTYATATTTGAQALGSKNFGAGSVVPAAIAAGVPTNSRKVTTAGFTDGVVAQSGTANWWAIVDVTNTRLLAVGQLSSALVVATGSPFALPAFDITLAGQ